jgi:hypothetical protein
VKAADGDDWILGITVQGLAELLTSSDLTGISQRNAGVTVPDDQTQRGKP